MREELPSNCAADKLNNAKAAGLRAAQKNKGLLALGQTLDCLPGFSGKVYPVPEAHRKTNCSSSLLSHPRVVHRNTHRCLVVDFTTNFLILHLNKYLKYTSASRSILPF